ncbi:hypothetical protein WA026_004007 [Henosepilachna vigintioctopunctata]|uniref:Uncharacterized protein n=1 Tax=Henosepilachna vigintioctopunctata TaxID=420089 RepID=A0AAW1UEH1_9CUCU
MQISYRQPQLRHLRLTGVRFWPVEYQDGPRGLTQSSKSHLTAISRGQAPSYDFRVVRIRQQRLQKSAEYEGFECNVGKTKHWACIDGHDVSNRVPIVSTQEKRIQSLKK